MIKAGAGGRSGHYCSLIPIGHQQDGVASVSEVGAPRFLALTRVLGRETVSKLRLVGFELWAGFAGISWYLAWLQLHSSGLELE